MVEPTLLRRAGQAIALGSQFSGFTLGGVVLGYFLDRWLGSGPLFLLVLALGGMMLGTWSLLRSLRNSPDVLPPDSAQPPEDPGSDRDRS